MNVLDVLRKIRQKESFIWTRRRVDPLVSMQVWKTYDYGFRQANLLTPCRQNFHRGEFMAVMRDPAFYKVFLFIDGKPVGLAILTLNLFKLPWINGEYFAIMYPDKIVAYVPCIVVAEGYRGDRRSRLLMDEMYRICDETHCDLLGMDHSTKVNAFLPAMIVRAFGGKVVLDGDPLDQQSYVLFSRGESSLEL